MNQYFGWYRWVEDFNDCSSPSSSELRDHYPKHAMVMTEWGAEARPELAERAGDAEGRLRVPDLPRHQRTLDVIDRSPVLSGAIYWTLREFEIFPAGPAAPGGGRPSTGPTPATTRA